MKKHNRWLGRTACNAGHLLAASGGRRSYRRWHKGKQRYVRSFCVYCKTCDHERRGKGVGKGWKRGLAKCPVGHPYEGTNLGVWERNENGKLVERRHCVECKRARWRRGAKIYYDKRKAAALESRAA